MLDVSFDNDCSEEEDLVFAFTLEDDIVTEDWVDDDVESRETETGMLLFVSDLGLDLSDFNEIGELKGDIVL